MQCFFQNSLWILSPFFGLRHILRVEKPLFFYLSVGANFGEILDNTRKIWYSHLDRGALHQEYPYRKRLPKRKRGKGWVPKWAFLGEKLGWQ